MAMKLIIQIPCYNEEESLPVVLAGLPSRIEGIDRIETLVIDDGSSDRTIEVARKHGVHHIVKMSRNRGLARAFIAGIEACVRAGADIIVNTDADNQYHSGDIAKIVQPILDGRADIVIGERPIMQTRHFSPIKKLLQRLGSWGVRKASRTRVLDAPSGFRAFARKAALQLKVFTEYTYTLETIIQAGQKGMTITSVPIRTNADLRPSRLVKSIWSYVWRSLGTMLRIFVVYRPLRFFFIVAVLLFGAGFAIGIRFLMFYLQGDGDGHVQSLILAAVLMSMGFSTFITGILSDLISVNRKLLEEVSARVWEIELARGSHSEVKQ